MSKLEKIQPIDADVSLSDRDSKMAEKGYTDVRILVDAEARQKIQSAPMILRGDRVACSKLGIQDIGDTFCAEAEILKAGGSWGQFAVEQDGSIYVAVRDTDRVLTTGIRGLEVVDKKRLDLEALIPPPERLAKPRYVKHLSRAHVTSKFADDFNRSDRDLDGDNGWVRRQNNELTMSIVSNLLRRSSSTTPHNSTYNQESAGATPASPDYTVGLVVTGPSGDYFAPTLRNESDGDCYFARLVGSSITIALRKRDGGDFETLASASHTSRDATIHIEAVGNQLKVYLDGSNTEKLGPTTDNTFSSAGFGGIFGNTGTDVPTADDWDLLVAATPPADERDIILNQNRIIRQTNQVLWHGVD